MLPIVTILGIQSTELLPPHSEGKVCGAYCLTHLPSGVTYVGSAYNLYSRTKMHQHLLKQRIHHVGQLQLLHNAGENLVFRYWLTKDRDLAFDIEQALADIYQKGGRLLNRGLDVRNPSKGLVLTEYQREVLSKTHKGKVISAETRKKMSDSRRAFLGIPPKPPKVNRPPIRHRPVSIDGIVYPQMKAAADALGLTKHTVRDRVLSKTDRFKEWFLVPLE